MNEQVSSILRAWLKEHGYDGLCSVDFECGCTIEDLLSCEIQDGTCQPAYRGPDLVGSKYDFVMYTTKEAVQEAVQREAEKDG